VSDPALETLAAEKKTRKAKRMMEKRHISMVYYRNVVCICNGAIFGKQRRFPKAFKKRSSGMVRTSMVKRGLP
jgi:hypothetical protein